MGLPDTERCQDMLRQFRQWDMFRQNKPLTATRAAAYLKTSPPWASRVMKAAGYVRKRWYRLTLFLPMREEEW